MSVHAPPPVRSQKRQSPCCSPCWCAARPPAPPSPLVRKAHAPAPPQSLGATSPAGKALVPDRLPQGVTEDPTKTGCLKDANADQNKCGEWAGATCVGSHGLGECCGKAGWCGTGPDYCDEGSVQANYSHGKGLCQEFGGFCSSGLTLEQLIDVSRACRGVSHACTP